MIAIVDYKAGNLTSVKRALEFLGHECEITDRAERIVAADRVILPGSAPPVPRWKICARSGSSKFSAMTSRAPANRSSASASVSRCCSIAAKRTTPNASASSPATSPAIHAQSMAVRSKSRKSDGTACVRLRPHPVFAGVPDNTHFYFVNSYYPILDDASTTLATCDYGVPFTAAVARDNVLATQFHLEKSGAAGLKMLDNFCRLKS